MDSDIQIYILKGLIHNITYFREVITNLDNKFFDMDYEGIFKLVKKHFMQYKKLPKPTVLLAEVSNGKYENEKIKEELIEVLKNIINLDFNSVEEYEWLFEQTKIFANEKAIFNVLRDGIQELDKKDEANYASIQQKLTKALCMNWKDDLGIDYFDENEFDEIYDQLSDVSLRIPLGISAIDNTIGGGIPTKTKFVMVFLGEAGLGKCTSYINTINIRNKTTGEIKQIQIGEFHNNIKEKNIIKN